MIKCFDVVRDVAEEATRQFSPDIVLIPERLDILREYCEAIDAVAAATDAESFEAEVDEEKLTVIVSIECAAFQIESPASPFYELIERSVSFGFRANREGNTVAYLEFPRLWERIEDTE